MSYFYGQNTFEINNYLKERTYINKSCQPILIIKKITITFKFIKNDHEKLL